MSTSRNTRIIMADDHELVRAGLKKLIHERRDLTVVGEARTGRELLNLLLEKECDLIILDLSMPDIDGLEALDIIHKRYKNTQVLVLSMHNNPAYLKRALARGASGYIIKEDAFDRLIWAIEEVRAGRKAFSRSISDATLEASFHAEDAAHHSAELLTDREREILSLVAQGMTSKDIAQKLDISPRTVESHRARMMEKLGIQNSAALIKFALSAKLL